ncbi:TPA: PTS transporter subunit EIIC [Klebsiella pneumoniae]|nr:PTS transporter subunit EIIC [Klebsiella pneumoniae]HBR7001441.1 PTS transporter subunit EIIC [Klebsiella pneumoniae]HBR7013166.1 PTS transporter subunit EIIC [Klebsiella pneumoniae]HBR7019614.1 PTS transporter subunit EIIC [Klebsiella pneumoniae]HBR7024891.1 PTS transporter subunit EIIC [Klebsiella pneumoniae]
MGITGLGLVWRAAAKTYDVSALPGEVFLATGLAVFLVLTGIQLLRLVFCRQIILAEWHSRASKNFFCAATISGFLLAMGLLPYSILLAKVLWIAAVAAQIFFLTCTFRRWLIDQLDTHEISPVWLIPMVGNASPAFAGVDLGFPGLSKMLLFSALLCWALFMPLILWRIVFVRPVTPQKAMPGLAIMVSAPAVIAVGLSSELTGAIIGASLLYPEFTSLAGQTLNIIGLPLVVMEYGYSIFPVFFAVPVAAALERFLKVRLWDSVQLFMVPLLCVVIVVPLTMFLLGPFGKYLGDYLASAIVYIIGVNSLVAGMIIGAAYSFIVLFGLHWAIIPVVFSNIAHGGDPIYAIGGMSAIAQMGVALGILIRTRDTGTRQLASSAFFPSLISGVTEPILYGLIIPNRRTIYYIIIAGAVGGGIVGGYNITINNLVFASLLSIPTASNMLIYSVGLFATLITGAVLPVIFGYKSRF